MEKELFSPMALDALGEMMNISLGSSATAVSNMLDQRVDITTPTVSVVPVKDFTLGPMEPAMGVEIQYVEGLEGSNIMLLKISDIRVIVDILMGTETADEDFELNELTISCVCEVMNQMMGAASTALSDFLGFPVNISTPEPFELDQLDEFKANHLPKGADTIVVVKFALKIEGASLESGFMNVMSVELAKELLAGFGLDLDEEEAPAPDPVPVPEPAPPSDSGRKMSQEEIERMLSGMGSEPEPTPVSAPAPVQSGGDSGRKMSQEEIERMLSGMSGEPAPTPEPTPAPVPPAPPTPPAAPEPATQTPPVPPIQNGQMPFYPPMPNPDGSMPNGYMGYQIGRAHV